MSWDDDDRRRNNDKLMMTIGELKADAKASQNQRTELFAKVAETKQDMTEIKTMLIENTSAIGAMLDKHEVKIEAFGEDIRGLKKFRQRMLLGIAGIAGSGGITGAVLTKLGLG